MLPLGLTNAPVAIMDLMNQVFKSYRDKFVIEFIDVILVYSSNEEKHEEHLRIMLGTLKEHAWYAKFFRCKFW